MGEYIYCEEDSEAEVNKRLAGKSGRLLTASPLVPVAPIRALKNSPGKFRLRFLSVDHRITGGVVAAQSL
jgi:hypothetical protein